MKTIATTLRLAAMLAVLLALPATAAGSTGSTRDTFRVAGKPSDTGAAREMPAKPLLPRARPRPIRRPIVAGPIVNRTSTGTADAIDALRWGVDYSHECSSDLRCFWLNRHRRGPPYCERPWGNSKRYLCAEFGPVWAEVINMVANEDVSTVAEAEHKRRNMMRRISTLREKCPVPSEDSLMPDGSLMLGWLRCVSRADQELLATAKTQDCGALKERLRQAKVRECIEAEADCKEVIEVMFEAKRKLIEVCLNKDLAEKASRINKRFN